MPVVEIAAQVVAGLGVGIVQVCGPPAADPARAGCGLDLALDQLGIGLAQLEAPVLQCGGDFVLATLGAAAAL